VFDYAELTLLLLRRVTSPASEPLVYTQHISEIEVRASVVYYPIGITTAAAAAAI